MNKVFTTIGWEDYCYWQLNDKTMVKKIHALIQDIERNGNEGIGKPEPLKYDLEGYWSRRISPEHRLIYKMDPENIYILQCRGHY